ncbi:MAG: DUF1499 domain-containing protein [Simkaniaceae bacterium]|nr:MAG: DUF1499 domain-containing protein [Simkaniaceae bacterium]
MASLSPCPNKPNCVNSQAQDTAHAIEPFPIYKTPQDSLTTIASVIRSMPRTTIVKETPNYIHAEFTSKIFHFTDDVEFLYNPTKNVIEVRSASRIGYGDLGVNRKRVETLRKAYEEKLNGGA